jgi:hypothetical protein
MPFEWLNRFHQEMEKPADYAQKTLAAYRLGMKAGGAIRGVIIQAPGDACPAAVALPVGNVYHPDEAPRLPLPACSQSGACRCVYRPVMAYSGVDGGQDSPDGGTFQ